MDVPVRERGEANDTERRNAEESDRMRAAVEAGQPLAFKTSFKTAIVNRKSAMQLLSQVLHVLRAPYANLRFFRSPRDKPLLPPPSIQVSLVDYSILYGLQILPSPAVFVQ